MGSSPDRQQSDARAGLTECHSRAMGRSCKGEWNFGPICRGSRSFATPCPLWCATCVKTQTPMCDRRDACRCAWPVARLNTLGGPSRSAQTASPVGEQLKMAETGGTASWLVPRTTNALHASDHPENCPVPQSRRSSRRFSPRDTRRGGNGPYFHPTGHSSFAGPHRVAVRRCQR